MRIITSYIRNKKKKVTEDDLSNPMKTFATTFKFLKEDIERFRSQNITPESLSVLHPWNYDID